MIKAEDFKWLDVVDWFPSLIKLHFRFAYRVYHLFHLGSYLCLSGALTDCFLPLSAIETPQVSIVNTYYKVYNNKRMIHSSVY